MAQGSKPESAGQTAGGLAPLTANNLQADGLLHGFFLRTGGVSEGIYASLNCGRGSKDARHHIEENRARVASQLGTASALLIGPYQVHSAKAVIVTEAWKPDEAPAADAVVTNVRGLAIGVLTADCVPILMADRQAGAIAAVHAGWKGAIGGVIESAIDAMKSLGADPARISAAIGPAISQAAYEVSAEFKATFLAASQASEKYFTQIDGNKPHFSLTAYVKDRLERCGVAGVQDTAMCTYKNESILFSYRRSVHRGEPDYGRQISAILLS
jgi:YfiH family protein